MAKETIKVKGKEYTISQAIETYGSEGVNGNNLRSRLRKGWTTIKALTTPIRVPQKGFIVKCLHCKDDIVTYSYYKTKYCSKKCKDTYAKVKGLLKGENNPNFGNTWSKERVEEFSKFKKKQFAENPELRWEAGKANRGVKLSKERIHRMFKDRPPRSFYNIKHSEETKRKIGFKSSAKFTPKFNRRLRETNERLGNWIPLKDKPSRVIYDSTANWVVNMWNFATGSELKLLRNVGIFNPYTNTEGVVRDHIYSRAKGFKLGVFPEILRHPENCQILLHSDNSIKRGGCEITLNRLFNNIRNTEFKWKEQNTVLDLIKRYRKGERWISPFKESK
jgi:hypothetical protein